jgi:hypothetical protein
MTPLFTLQEILFFGIAAPICISLLVWLLFLIIDDFETVVFIGVACFIFYLLTVWSLFW